MLYLSLSVFFFLSFLFFQPIPPNFHFHFLHSLLTVDLCTPDPVALHSTSCQEPQAPSLLTTVPLKTTYSWIYLSLCPVADSYALLVLTANSHSCLFAAWSIYMFSFWLYYALETLLLARPGSEQWTQLLCYRFFECSSPVCQNALVFLCMILAKPAIGFQNPIIAPECSKASRWGKGQTMQLLIYWWLWQHLRLGPRLKVVSNNSLIFVPNCFKRAVCEIGIAPLGLANRCLSRRFLFKLSL